MKRRRSSTSEGDIRHGSLTERQCADQPSREKYAGSTMKKRFQELMVLDEREGLLLEDILHRPHYEFLDEALFEIDQCRDEINMTLDLEAEDKSKEALGPLCDKLYTTLPRELRDQVYTQLHPAQCNFSDSGYYWDSKWYHCAELVGEGVARELAESNYTETKFCVSDRALRALTRLLREDRHKLGLMPHNLIRNIQIALSLETGIDLRSPGDQEEFRNQLASLFLLEKQKVHITFCVPSSDMGVGTDEDSNSELGFDDEELIGRILRLFMPVAISLKRGEYQVLVEWPEEVSWLREYLRQDLNSYESIEEWDAEMTAFELRSISVAFDISG
ncbi:hypothetical protein BDV95DRAFT_670529 [Massariosphaeria phaeospora]|uniref:Uncharacterized protein n=1 Tax=Massariosphaeria phaeospora TaxID=100035 RepID=A0A7C8M4Y5_9PLEO|nr:hypothetical protein BDV95DRAFT_670529 [Massariosphaeria phaeospora]